MLETILYLSLNRQKVEEGQAIKHGYTCKHVLSVQRNIVCPIARQKINWKVRRNLLKLRILQSSRSMINMERNSETVIRRMMEETRGEIVYRGWIRVQKTTAWVRMDHGPVRESPAKKCPGKERNPIQK